MVSEPEFKRIYWSSRRGMLELDLILVPFGQQRYPQLSPARQELYRRLLECEDTELFAWLLGRGRPTDPELAEMVDDILQFNAGVDARV